jgi:hypothetical protein
MTSIDPGYLDPMSQLDFLDQGSLGIFYPWLGTEPPDDEHKERGWIVRSGGWAHVDALEERDTPGVMVNGHFEADRFPEALVGRLPSTTVMALELLPRGSTKVFGLNASTRRYRARTLVAGVPLDRLRSSRLTSLTSEYLGLGHWSGIRAGEETWTQAPDGTIQAFELKVGAPPPDTRLRLSGGRSIAVSAHWSVTGPNDDRRIRMPMAVRIEATRPLDVVQFLAPLVHVQNLVSTVFSGFVASTGASAGLDLTPPGQHQRNAHRTFPCWSGPLFQCPDGVPPAGSTSWPGLSLSDLGGAAGAARWIRLCEQHPRATSPAVSPYRFGLSTVETELLSIAAAFEYWVAVHRRNGVRWAVGSARPKGISGHEFLMRCLVHRAGSSFTDFVGDATRWTADFSNSYNRLKHDPSAALDPVIMADLVRSGRLLLFGLLADRIAGTRVPTRKLFSHNAQQAFGSRLRARYA